MNTIWKAQLLVLVLLASAALRPQTDSQAQTNDASQTSKPATLNRVRVSPGIAAGNLIHKIVPEYPLKAKENHIQGEVQLRIIIDKQGQVIDLKTVSGHPDLVPAATDAVKQWRYKPYLLNGEPVEVETTVTVNFNQAPAPGSSSSPTAPSSTTAPAPGASTASAANPSSSDSSPPPPGYPKVTMNRVRVSGGVAESYLIHKIVPEYPAQARQSGIQGTVVLHAIIDKAGYIIELNPLSGNPMLVPAALDAVKQWRYSPYILNGDPVEMETTVSVNFDLANSTGVSIH
jgi:TonB family protein